MINDLDSDLICFYRVLQNHLEEFLKQFKWLLASREWFEDWKRQQVAGGLTDIQRAARYYYLQRLCFAGRVRGRTYGASPMSRPRINLLRIEEELSEVHLRLSSVTIEHLPWQKFLKTYDKPGTLFFLDPPYYRASYYNHNLDLSDYEKLASALASLESHFILSLNDHQEMRRIFARFRFRMVSLRYSASRINCNKARELLITK